MRRVIEFLIVQAIKLLANVVIPIIERAIIRVVKIIIFVLVVTRNDFKAEDNFLFIVAISQIIAVVDNEKPIAQICLEVQEMNILGAILV